MTTKATLLALLLAALLFSSFIFEVSCSGDGDGDGDGGDGDGGDGGGGDDGDDGEHEQERKHRKLKVKVEEDGLKVELESQQKSPSAVGGQNYTNKFKLKSWLREEDREIFGCRMQYEIEGDNVENSTSYFWLLQYIVQYEETNGKPGYQPAPNFDSHDDKRNHDPSLYDVYVADLLRPTGVGDRIKLNWGSGYDWQTSTVDGVTTYTFTATDNAGYLTVKLTAVGAAVNISSKTYLPSSVKMDINVTYPWKSVDAPTHLAMLTRLKMDNNCDKGDKKHKDDKESYVCIPSDGTVPPMVPTFNYTDEYTFDGVSYTLIKTDFSDSSENSWNTRRDDTGDDTSHDQEGGTRRNRRVIFSFAVNHTSGDSGSNLLAWDPEFGVSTTADVLSTSPASRSFDLPFWINKLSYFF